MGSRLTSLPEELFEAEKYSRLKIIFLSVAFFCIIGGYTLARELKNTLFIAMVGKDFAPIAKVLSFIVLIPAVLFYSKLVDSMRRYHVLMVCSAFFGIMGLVFTFLIGHPTIGLLNVDKSPYRIFAWLFYFFGEGYSPFVVSVLWAFVTSITSPEESKRNYGVMVAASKIGGALSAAFAWALFSWSSNLNGLISHVFLHQLVLGISSLMFILVIPVIYLLIRRVPKQYLHGYEAAYQLEKEKVEKEEPTQTQDVQPPILKEPAKKEGMLSGLYLLFKYPYVFGMFGLVFFHEIMDTIFSFLRLAVGEKSSTDIAGFSAFLFQTAFYAHLSGIFISYFGTTPLLTRLGERVCLLIVPLLNGILLLYFIIDQSSTSFLIVTSAIKSLHYGFSLPVRESLYIPTIKEIRFKSKSWIDGFGGKFAKAAGSLFNIVLAQLGGAFFLPVYAFSFASLISCWFVSAFFLGKRFDQAIKKNEVIGAEVD